MTGRGGREAGEEVEERQGKVKRDAAATTAKGHCRSLYNSLAGQGTV